MGNDLRGDEWRWALAFGVVSFAYYNECQRGYEKDGWSHFACLLCVSVLVSCACVLKVGLLRGVPNRSWEREQFTRTTRGQWFINGRK